MARLRNNPMPESMEERALEAMDLRVAAQYAALLGIDEKVESFMREAVELEAGIAREALVRLYGGDSSLLEVDPGSPSLVADLIASRRR